MCVVLVSPVVVPVCFSTLSFTSTLCGKCHCLFFWFFSVVVRVAASHVTKRGVVVIPRVGFIHVAWGPWSKDGRGGRERAAGRDKDGLGSKVTGPGGGRRSREAKPQGTVIGSVPRACQDQKRSETDETGRLQNVIGRNAQGDKYKPLPGLVRLPRDGGARRSYSSIMHTYYLTSPCQWTTKVCRSRGDAGLIFGPSYGAWGASIGGRGAAEQESGFQSDCATTTLPWHFIEREPRPFACH